MKFVNKLVIFFVIINLCSVTYAKYLPQKSTADQLTANTPLRTVYKYQAFFQDKNNIPQIQVASPKTLYLWQNMSKVFKTEMLLRDGKISELPIHINNKIGALAFERKEIGKTTVEHFFNQYPLDAMIVVDHGTIVYEKYKTMRVFDKHNWFSTGKVISSTMIALFEAEGKIDVTKYVTQYLPALKGSIWDTVPVIDVLNMATGLDSTEHEEPNDDARINPERGWYQWAVSIGIFPEQKSQHHSPLAVLRKMKRVKPGNTAFEYNSINTWVLELIVEQVAGKPLNEVFGDYVWRKIGAQADGFIGITPDGYPMAWGFTSSTLRDLARFGIIYTPSWNKISKDKIISDDMLKKIQHSGKSIIFGKGYVGREMLGTLYDSNLTNGYQWDVVFPDGDLFKGGVGGQGLYISPKRDLVIAWFSTGENNEQVMARAIATSSILKSE